MKWQRHKLLKGSSFVPTMFRIVIHQMHYNFVTKSLVTRQLHQRCIMLFSAIFPFLCRDEATNSERLADIAQLK